MKINKNVEMHLEKESERGGKCGREVLGIFTEMKDTILQDR